MIFNPCKSKDFMPTVEVNGQELEVVEDSKLLGVMISSDLNWALNTEYIVKRANSKLWCLRRLKSHGADSEDLLDVLLSKRKSLLNLQHQFSIPPLL